MKNLHKPIAVFALPLTLIGTVYAGYQTTSQPSASSVNTAANIKSPRTTTMVLPAKTNNAWELPPINLQGLDGKQHNLTEWKGRVIMLNFWASWCAPCQYEIKDFISYQEKYQAKGLQIIGLGLDEERKLQNASRTLSVNYPVLISNPANSDALLEAWGNPQRVVPYTVVIARDGRIAYIHRGQLDPDTFQEFVVPLF
ncbi:MAG: TlpA family protein disulfide reductase [Sedimenticola sp.]|nr:TlpA family protein disulfide reductase [Sedimenticola sp.]